MPLVAHAKQGDSESRLAPCLADQGAARRDRNQDVHFVGPILGGVVEDIAIAELVDDQAVVGEQYELGGLVSSLRPPHLRSEDRSVLTHDNSRM